MKKFFKCLLRGTWAAILVALVAVIVWAFVTLTAVVVVGSVPVWIIAFSRLSAKVDSFKEMATVTIDKVERILNDAK